MEDYHCRNIIIHVHVFFSTVKKVKTTTSRLSIAKRWTPKSWTTPLKKIFPASTIEVACIDKKQWKGESECSKLRFYLLALCVYVKVGNSSEKNHTWPWESFVWGEIFGNESKTIEDKVKTIGRRFKQNVAEYKYSMSASTQNSQDSCIVHSVKTLAALERINECCAWSWDSCS